MHDIRPIRTDDDLSWALQEVAVYFGDQPAPGSADADRFDVLSDLIEAYENRHHPINAPEPVDMLQSYMAMTGKGQADLAAVLGSRSRASEVLNGKRPLSIDMIRRLHQNWGLPTDALIGAGQRAAA